MKDGIKIITTNKKALFDYQIIERIEAGLVLTGSEVKSLREGRCNLRDSYGRIRNGEVWLVGMHISPYKHEGYKAPDPERERKLLLHKDEIKRIQRKILEKGVTLIPLKLYFKNGLAKVEIGIATGKRQYDKRTDIARREQERELKRLEKKYRIK
ncbi:MAG: SsrA-binding protein SmpB [Calditrichia bacterium]